MKKQLLFPLLLFLPFLNFAQSKIFSFSLTTSTELNFVDLHNQEQAYSFGTMKSKPTSVTVAKKRLTDTTTMRSTLEDQAKSTSDGKTPVKCVLDVSLNGSTAQKILRDKIQAMSRTSTARQILENYLWKSMRRLKSSTEDEDPS